MSQLWARRSCRVCLISSGVSPKPNMRPDLVGMPGCWDLKLRSNAKDQA